MYKRQVLFCTALATTFVAFRVAARVGIQEATVWGAASPPPVDRSLLLGSVFFGVGWGASGLCPGPLLVDVGAAPGAPGLMLMLLTVALGMALARPISEGGGAVQAPPAPSGTKADSGPSILV